MTVERHGQITRLLPEQRLAYLQLHAAVWPDVEATIAACNIQNYTIFTVGDVLIAYFEYTGSDFEFDMARMAADPVTKQWWSLTDPCQESWFGESAVSKWTDATEIWHLE